MAAKPSRAAVTGRAIARPAPAHPAPRGRRLSFWTHRPRLRRAVAILGGAAVLVVAAATVRIVQLARARAVLMDPEPTLLVRDRHGRHLCEVAGGVANPDADLGHWRIDALPPRVVAATLTVEDRRFWDHAGVDPRAIARAIVQNLCAGRRISGASTIAMQLARLQSRGERTWWNKAVETLTALLLVDRFGHERVLTQYLRLAPYGNRIHGIGFAARRYFDKPVDDLSWAETAFLAALPQAPGRMNPHDGQGRGRAVTRAERILDLLLAEGRMTPREHALARHQLGELEIPERAARPRDAMHVVLRLDTLLRDPAARAELATRPLVQATLDAELQTWLTELLYDAVSGWQAQGAGNAAAMVLDVATGDVLAAVGSTGYFDDASAGAIDFAATPRAAGSTLKPFLYALALDRGAITPATILDDLGRAPGGEENADRQYLGPLLPRQALGNSRNVPAALLLRDVGLGVAYGHLAELGLHAGNVPAERYGLGLAVGSLPVTLEALVTAYTALARDGMFTAPRWYVGQPHPAERRLFSEDAARQVTRMLADPMARLPTFPRMGNTEYPFPVAVKTGTSSQYRDAWSVAYSRTHLVGVWVGDPGYRPMNGLSGYRAAAELAQRILTHLHPDELDGLGDLAFPAPRGHVEVRLCGLTGKLATPSCDHVALEMMRPGEAPVEACTAHIPIAVDTRDGLAASATTPREAIELRTFVDLGPRYAAWAAAAGLPAPPGARGVGGNAGLTPRADDRPIRVAITEPEDGLRLFVDPESPPELSTLMLKVVVDPPTAQVVWYVDGEPFETADFPYESRWRLRRGEHTIQARLPFGREASAAVKVRVE